MADLTIGLKVDSVIYLTLAGANTIAPINIDSIKSVDETRDYTIITHSFGEGTIPIIVTNKKADIEHAMGDAIHYKNSGLAYINSELGKTLPKQEFELLFASYLNDKENTYRFDAHIVDVIEGFAIFSIKFDKGIANFIGQRADIMSDNALESKTLDELSDFEISKLIAVIKNINLGAPTIENKASELDSRKKNNGKKKETV